MIRLYKIPSIVFRFLCRGKWRTHRYLGLIILIRSLLNVPAADARQLPDTSARYLSALLVQGHNDSSKAEIVINTALLLAIKPGLSGMDLSKMLAYATEAQSICDRQHFVTAEGEAYLTMLTILTKQKNTEKLADVQKQALRFFKKHPYPIQKIDALLSTGNYYNPQIYDKLDQKIALYGAAVSLMRLTHPGSLKLAGALRNLGNLHMYIRRDEPVAVDELKEALRLYQANKNEELQDIYGLLTGLLSDLENYREALRYGLLAVQTVDKFRDSSLRALAAYDNLGTLYYGINDYRNASKYLIQGLAMARQAKNAAFIYDISHDLSVTYFKLRQPQKAVPILTAALKMPDMIDTPRRCLITADLLSAYTETKAFGPAEQQVGPLLKLIDLISDEGNAAKDNGRRLLIVYFLATKQYSRIPQLLEKSREFAEKRKQLKLIGAVEQYAFKLDSANKKYISAIGHYQKFKELNDSVSKRNQDKQLATLQVQYETEKKNQKIGSLTRQTELQRSALKSQQLARNMLFAGIALLVLLLGLGYSRYQIKRRANHELSEQQEEINTQNESLKQLLTEREWLLKEIHHRVKNNLQIVISLLNSQSAYLKDPAMKVVLKESQNRMRSISLIHQKLYQGDNLSGIDMLTYIRELVDHLQYSFDTEGKIAFLIAVDKVTMDVSQAVPIGLILNEAITNAIKYAFKGQENAHVRIELKVTPPDNLMVRVADNGRGLPGDFDQNRLNSLGMNLMKGLSRQIGAEFEIQNKAGLTIQLTGKMTSVLSNSNGPGRC